MSVPTDTTTDECDASSYQIWPDVKGLDKFEGTLCHSASWPEDLDLAGKTVAVVGGGGASGVQIVPAIQPIVKKLIVYLRSPVWATPGFRSKFLGPDGQNFDCKSFRRIHVSAASGLTIVLFLQIARTRNGSGRHIPTHWINTAGRPRQSPMRSGQL